MMAAGLSSTLKKRQDKEEVLLMLNDRRKITTRINSSGPNTVAGSAAAATEEERAAPGPQQDETSPRRPVPAAHYPAVGASLSRQEDSLFLHQAAEPGAGVPPQHVGYLTRQRRPEISRGVNLKSLDQEAEDEENISDNMKLVHREQAATWTQSACLRLMGSSSTKHPLT